MPDFQSDSGPFEGIGVKQVHVGLQLSSRACIEDTRGYVRKPAPTY